MLFQPVSICEQVDSVESTFLMEVEEQLEHNLLLPDEIIILVTI